MSAVVSIVKNGPEIRLLRERCGLSQAQLAEAIGTSQQTIDRIERGVVLSSRSSGPALDCLRSILAKREGPGIAPTSGTAAPTSDVVIHAQHEIEVYQNSSGGIVVKMEAGGVYEEDQVVVIRPENIDAIVAALLRVKGEALS